MNDDQINTEITFFTLSNQTMDVDDFVCVLPFASPWRQDADPTLTAKKHLDFSNNKNTYNKINA